LPPKIATSGSSSRDLKMTDLDSVNVEILYCGLYWILKYKSIKGVRSELKAQLN
jgi:hypothetical protein